MEKLIIIGDFLKDLDDEHTLIAAVELERQGLIEILCVIGNLAPASMRARGAKGTLQTLGRGNVPVGVGLPVFEGKAYPYESEIPYLAPETDVEPGYELMVRTLEAQEDESVTLLLISGLTDAAKLVVTAGHLLNAKLKGVVIMGGVEVEDESVKLNEFGFMTPNNANNNSFDMTSAIFLHQKLQELGIPMTIVTREVAYSSGVPFAMYDKLVGTGNPVGECLRNRQKPSLQHLWEAACSGPNSELRGTLPNDRDRAWFLKVFCGGEIPENIPGNDIWPFVKTFNLYDPTALYAAVPSIRDRFYEPTHVVVNNTIHNVIGVSQKAPGVRDIRSFIEFMVETEVKGLS